MEIFDSYGDSTVGRSSDWSQYVGVSRLKTVVELTKFRNLRFSRGLEGIS